MAGLLENSYKAQTKQKCWKRILAGSIVRKYRKISFQNFAPKGFMKKSKVNHTNLAYRNFKHTPKIPGEKQDVIKILEMDCHSRMTSSLRETISQDKEKVKKRFLFTTMQGHKEFKYSIAYTKFSSLRPFWVLFPNCDKRDTYVPVINMKT